MEERTDLVEDVFFGVLYDLLPGSRLRVEVLGPRAVAGRRLCARPGGAPPLTASALGNCGKPSWLAFKWG